MGGKVRDLSPGAAMGQLGEFGSVFGIAEAADEIPSSTPDNRRLHWDSFELKSYDWTVKISEFFLELTTIDQFAFEVLFHWEVESPIAAANDHDWLDDVHFDFTVYTQSGAKITSFSYEWRRKCFRYLHEVPGIRYTSEVAWPVRNLGYQEGAGVRSGYHRLRVTGCGPMPPGGTRSG